MEDLYLQNVQTLNLEKISKLLEVPPQEVYSLFKEGDTFVLRGLSLQVIRKTTRELVCKTVN